MASPDSATASDLDAQLARIAAGESLTEAELTALAAASDILPVGMLADAARRRLHGARTTYVRVLLVAADGAAGAEIPDTAREVRLTATTESLDAAVAAVAAVSAKAQGRAVSGFSWADIERWAGEQPVSGVLQRLRSAGLDRLADLPVDQVADLERAVAALVAAGFADVVVTVRQTGAISERLEQFLRVGALGARVPQIRALAPLPTSVNALRPSTGYDDVKAVALARLAVPERVHVQVDWLRYGPKLAQVALTFGADDLDAVSPSDDAPDGRRRAPLEELRRNIEAAGLTAAERDGRFAVLAG